MSSLLAPNSIAAAASAMRSPARGPRMWTPSTRSVFLSASTLMRPSVWPSARARPLGPWSSAESCSTGVTRCSLSVGWARIPTASESATIEVIHDTMLRRRGPSIRGRCHHHWPAHVVKYDFRNPSQEEGGRLSRVLGPRERQSRHRGCACS